MREELQIIPSTYWVNSESLVAALRTTPPLQQKKAQLQWKSQWDVFLHIHCLPRPHILWRFISVNLFLSAFLLMSRSFKKTPIAWMNFTVFTPFGKLSKFCSIWYLVQVMMQSKSPLASSPGRNFTSLCSQSAIFSSLHIPTNVS